MTDRARLATVAIGGAFLGVMLYLLASRATFRIGFPLDDAWIHQTYARNLAATGQWAFVSGEPSGGSTSPLWTMALALGRRLGLDPRGWAYTLGASALAGSAIVAAAWFRRRTSASINWVLVVGFTFVLEWHLVWSAVSGMEVILLVALAAAVMLLSELPIGRPAALGVLVGLGIWIRPDAITLALVPMVALLADRERSARDRLSGAGWLVAGMAVMVVPYLFFNLRTAGTIWPSTFYAKQAEYAVLRDQSIALRFLRVGAAPFIGPAVLLLPGIAVAAVVAIRRGRWASLSPMAWALFYLGIFAGRLPVTYQHGRYQIPALPVLVVLGWEGIYLATRQAGTPPARILVRAWAAAVVAATIAFVVLGAQAYARDVAVIESEMVDTARWISTHTEADDLVAAHDIGALGYFGGRRVLDLAGLAEADVIPILRNESALAELLDQRRAGILMTFPSWYPALTACADLVYVSDGRFSPQQGGENMHVYAWPATPVARPEGCMLYSP